MPVNSSVISGIVVFVSPVYEIHGNFADAQGLKWYVGPGAHIGFYDYHDNHNNHIDGTYIGIDGVLGLDYKFNGAPINISIDWQPSFEFGDYVGFSAAGVELESVTLFKLCLFSF